MPFLFLLLLGLEPFRPAPTVRTGFKPTWYPRTPELRPTLGASFFVSLRSPELNGFFGHSGNMSLAENDGSFGETLDDRRPPKFPGEHPSEVELQQWVEKATNYLRGRGLLKYAETASPARTAEYMAKQTLAPAPGRRPRPAPAAAAPPPRARSCTR